MTKSAPAALFLCLAAFSVSAQQTETPISSARNSLSFDAGRLLNNDNNIYGLLYKRQFTASALRIGLNGGYFNNERKSPLEEHRSLSVLPQIGIEWQKSFNDRWMWYYGVDLQGNFTRNRSRISDDFAIINEINTELNGAKLIGFAGIRYELHERFSISAEPEILSVGYSKIETNFEQTGAGPAIPRESIKESRADVNVMQRIHLFLTYKF